MGLFFLLLTRILLTCRGKEHLGVSSDRELQSKWLDSDSCKHYFYNWSVQMKTHYVTMDGDPLCDKDDKLRSEVLM